MKLPQSPKPLSELVKAHAADIARLLGYVEAPSDGKYRHWDDLRQLTPPGGLNHEQWWVAVKLARHQQYRELPLKTSTGRPLVFSLPDQVLERLHFIDSRTHRQIGLPVQTATEEVRYRYVFSSLVEEAIASSQLEGASMPRSEAADMIRYGRKPRDVSERMILNNFLAMQRIHKLAEQELNFRRLMNLHTTLMEDTLDDPGTRAPVERLEAGVKELIAFANHAASDRPFLHPVIRAVVLHFWLASLHPFADGNGRTARALFYWSLLRQGYWWFRFVSISRLLNEAQAQYYRAFLYTQSDENDLTYFIIHQLDVIKRAIDGLDIYLERKADQIREVEKRLPAGLLNHRQIELLSHAIRHPNAEYSIKSHQTSHNVAYATARADLFGLSDRGLLDKRRIGKKTFVFVVPDELENRVAGLG